MTKTWGKEIWELKSKNQKGIAVSKGVFGQIQGKKNYHEGMKNVQNELSEFLKRRPIKNVLEIGPGPDAINAKFFRNKGYELDLVDVSPNTIKLAKEKLEPSRRKNSAKSSGKLKDDKIGYFCQDVTELNIPKKYSLIFCHGTFLHVPPSFAIIVMNNFQKHLKKGGYLIIDFPIKKEMTIRRKLFELIYYLGHRIKTKITGKNFYVTCAEYTHEELKEICRRTNFKLISDKNLWVLQK